YRQVDSDRVLARILIKLIAPVSYLFSILRPNSADSSVRSNRKGARHAGTINMERLPVFRARERASPLAVSVSIMDSTVNSPSSADSGVDTHLIPDPPQYQLGKVLEVSPA